MAANLTHVKTKQSLKGLYPLLTSWLELIETYCAAWNYDDCPWWFNERATLSTLAGAAWRLGPNWIALEEYSTRKRGVLPEKKIEGDAIVRGRCDLYVAHGSNDFGIEAKQSWQSISSKAKKERLPIAMRAAKRDAGNLMSTEARNRIGAVFSIPHLPVREVQRLMMAGQSEDDAILQIVNEWLASLELANFDAVAYFFSGMPSKLQGGNVSDRVFPGVLLTMTRCKTGTYNKTVSSK